MTDRLAGKRIIVSGAAGGIGSAAVRAFVAEGAFVGLLDRSGQRLDELDAELGTAALALPCDVASESEVSEAMSKWRSAQSGLDVVYSCSGIQLHGLDGPLHELSMETWSRTFEVNATGVFVFLKHALPLMIESGGGSVIICGSPTALTLAAGGGGAYAASKAAAMGLTRSVAADYAKQGIRANSIVPGATATPLIAELLENDTRRTELELGTPLGRIGTPADLTGIAVFLASDESSYATGAVFAVDGGVTIR